MLTADPARPPHQHAAGPDALPRPGSRRDLALLAGLAAVAFLVRLVPVLVRGDLTGLFSYDDGVYFGAAVALVHGRLPYGDFLLLHPPGILYLLAPIAALGHVLGDAGAFAAARLAVMLLGAANTILVMLVAGTWGRRAAIAAGALYAVWPAAVGVERTTWLIAPQSTLLLLALLVLARAHERGAITPGRAAIAGGCAGATFALQVWAVVPIAVLLGWLVLVSWRTPRNAMRLAVVYLFAAGLAAGVALLPFLLAAPESMFRYVILDQLGRTPASGSLVDRLRAIEGLPVRAPIVRRIPGELLAIAFATAAAIVAWAAVRRPALRLPVALAGAQIVVLVVAPPFNHYAGWLTPAASVAIGTAFADLAGFAGRGAVRRAIWVTYGAALAVLLAVSSSRALGRPVDVPTIRAATADATCVAADNPAVLMAAGLLDRVLHAGCPLLLDPTGVSHDLGRELNAPRRALVPYQRAMQEYYGNADAVLFVRLDADGLSDETWAVLRSRFSRVTEVGPVTMLTR